MDWITEQIAIGNFLDATQRSGEVDAILCLKEHCCNVNRTDVDILCMPLVDGPGNNTRYIKEAICFIDDVVKAGDKILVHCHAGRSRSAVIVAQYFIEFRGMTRHSALEVISQKRVIYLSDGIDEIFKN